ncbi:MAG TPA: hypothetical protein GXX36_03905 [Clostridiaceae bacterium]|nr:hypothetical protein [Clostridiaceae bacterium]
MKRKLLTATLIIAMAACILLIPLTVYASQGTDTVISVNAIYVDNLNDRDEVDTFRFSISEPGSLQVRFEYDIEGEYDIEIFQATPTSGLVSIQRQSFYTYAASITGRYTQEGDKIRVPAGNYCVNVQRRSYSDFSSNEYYLTIKYSAEPGNDYEKEPNNEAKNATLISSNVSCTGNLNNRDDVDYYVVSLPYPGSIQVKFEYDINGEYNVEVFELNSLNNLNSIQNMDYYSYATSLTGRYTQLGDKLRVAEGDYYFAVKRRSFGDYSNSDYILTVNYNAEPGNDFEKENNNSARSATFIGCNSPCTGNLSNRDDIDYYLVKLPTSGNLQVSLEYDTEGEYNVEIFKVDSLNNLVSIQSLDYYSYATTVTGRYTQQGNKLKLEPGDYYFAVKRRAFGDYSNSDYVLTVLSDVKTATPSDNSGTKVIVQPNKSTVLVNGRKIAFDSYNIGGYNYFKLRDLAQAVNGTNKNFEVTWDGAKNAINLFSNRPYTPVGNELKTSPNLTSKVATPTSSAIYLDGKPVTLIAYNIDGNNYFKLRDILKLFDIGVTWNGKTNTIEINTNTSYVE